MLNHRLNSLMEQARTELIEIYPPLLIGFYKALIEQGADKEVAFDLTSQLFQHYLNKGSEENGERNL